MMNPSQATPMVPSNLLATLRAATRNEHSSLERHPLLQSLISDQLVLQDYLMVLRALLAFYRQLEPQLEGKLPVDCQLVGYRYLPRSTLLMADLDRLSGHWHSLDADRVPLLPLPDLSTSDRVVGVLYVLEGATQGGRVIAPRAIALLAEAELPGNELALDESDGVQYFQLFRQNEWAKLQRVIARVSLRPHAVDEAVTAAIETFRSLGGYLDYYLTVQRH
jgi:heme oxygenase